MSLKNRLRIAIVALVGILVLFLSSLSLRLTAQNIFQEAWERSQSIALQVRHLVVQRVNERAGLLSPPPLTSEDLKHAFERIVEEDEALPVLLRQTMANSSVVVEIQICSSTGRLLVTYTQGQSRLSCQTLSSLEEWQGRSLWDRLAEVLARSLDYAITVPLGIEDSRTPVMTIRALVSTILLRNSIWPQVRSLGIVFLLALLGALALAAFFSKFLLRELDRLGRQIENITTGTFSRGSAEPARETKEFAAVHSKLDLLSQRYRGAKEDVAQLRGNLERMLSRLEEALLLLDSDLRLMRASRFAGQMLGNLPLGEPLSTLFPGSAVLCEVATKALAEKQGVTDALLTLDRSGHPALRLLVSVELLECFPEPGRSGILLALRDADTRRQIRSQLDISTRLAAISRLTGGVAHEIKNPLNAIALHLEVLKARLTGDGEGHSELGVIAREIARLDRVVKTFLDFTRPVELRLQTLDLADISRQIAALVKVEAERLQVLIDLEMPHTQAWIRGDTDLLKQAILNVVKNGIEAMPKGGRLLVRVERVEDDWAVSVADSGPGIPQELRDRIFSLYFTTKAGGSGIGLAMTFRIVQLHNGSIDFASEPGNGALFRMCFPAYDEQVEAAAGQGAAADREPPALVAGALPGEIHKEST